MGVIDRILERVRGGKVTPEIVQKKFSGQALDAIDTFQSSFSIPTIPYTDEVLEEFAPFQRLAYYQTMLRQSGYLYGIVGLRVDAAFALPHAWVSGMPGDEEADRLRDIVEDAWNALQDRDAAVRKLMVYAIFSGIGFGEYAEWGVHVVTRGDTEEMIIAPKRIIDRPCDRFVFRKDGKLQFQSTQYGQDAKLVDELQIAIARYGSADWYGEAQAKYIHTDFWEMYQIRRMALESLEKQGYPLVRVALPRDVDDDILRAYRAAVRLQYPNSIVYRGFSEREEWSEGTRDSFPTFVGRDQIERINQLQNTISIGLLGVVFNNNTGVGAYAKDKTAAVQLFDKTPADVGVYDHIANDFGNKVCAVNAPEVPRVKWPVHVSDSAPQEDLDSWTANVVQMVGIGMEVDAEAAAEKLGIPLGDSEGEGLVLRQRAEPAPVIVPPQPPAPEPPADEVPTDPPPPILMSESGQRYELAEFDEVNQTIKLRKT